MMTSLNFCVFGQVSAVVGQHSPVERHVPYTFSERRLYWLSHLFYKIQKTVFDLEK